MPTPATSIYAPDRDKIVDFLAFSASSPKKRSVKYPSLTCAKNLFEALLDYDPLLRRHVRTYSDEVRIDKAGWFRLHEKLISGPIDFRTSGPARTGELFSRLEIFARRLESFQRIKPLPCDAAGCGSPAFFVEGEWMLQPGQPLETVLLEWDLIAPFKPVLPEALQTEFPDDELLVAIQEEAQCYLPDPEKWLTLRAGCALGPDGKLYVKCDKSFIKSLNQQMIIVFQEHICLIIRLAMPSADLAKCAGYSPQTTTALLKLLSQAKDCGLTQFDAFTAAFDSYSTAVRANPALPLAQVGKIREQVVRQMLAVFLEKDFLETSPWRRPYYNNWLVSRRSSVPSKTLLYPLSVVDEHCGVGKGVILRTGARLQSRIEVPDMFDSDRDAGTMDSQPGRDGNRQGHPVMGAVLGQDRQLGKLDFIDAEPPPALMDIGDSGALDFLRAFLPQDILDKANLRAVDGHSLGRNPGWAGHVLFHSRYDRFSDVILRDSVVIDQDVVIRAGSVVEEGVEVVNDIAPFSHIAAHGVYSDEDAARRASPSTRPRSEPANVGGVVQPPAQPTRERISQTPALERPGSAKTPPEPGAPFQSISALATHCESEAGKNGTTPMAQLARYLPSDILGMFSHVENREIRDIRKNRNVPDVSPRPSRSHRPPDLTAHAGQARDSVFTTTPITTTAAKRAPDPRVVSRPVANKRLQPTATPPVTTSVITIALPPTQQHFSGPQASVGNTIPARIERQVTMPPGVSPAYRPRPWS
jgi:hypothetical protein